MINHLYILYKLYPRQICLDFSNPNITENLFLDIVKKNPWKDDRLNSIGSNPWRSFSTNPNLTLSFIKKYINRPFHWEYLLNKKIIDLEFIVKNRISISYTRVNTNVLTLDYVEQHIHYAWNWEQLINDGLITFEFIDRHPELEWHIEHISKSPHITLDIINYYEDSLWNWKEIIKNINVNKTDMAHLKTAALKYMSNGEYFQYLSSNKTLTLQYFKENIGAPWDWLSLTCRDCITSDFIYDNPELPWGCYAVIGKPNINSDLVISIIRRNINTIDWRRLSEYDNITLEMIDSNPDLPWDPRTLVKCKNLTWEYIKNNPNKTWLWDHLSSSPIITSDIVKNHPNIPWVKEQLTRNPNIGAKYILENIRQHYYWDGIAKNLFGKHPITFARYAEKKYLDIWRIKVNKRKKMRRDLYDPVLDVLHLRIRDYERGIRATLT